MSKSPNNMLLLVYLHGFKGGADTFGTFPDRIQHVLTESHSDLTVESCVYPAYDTRGELVTAVDNHVVWLTNLVAERKAASLETGGDGNLRVVLLGHSMGGLVAADTVLSTLDQASLPILGVIAFDTPYLGLSPSVFRNTIDKAVGYASQGQAALAALGVGYSLFKSATGSTTPPADASNSSSSATTSASASKPNSSASRNPDKAVAPVANAAPQPTSWFSLKSVAGAVAAASALGAAGAAYYNRDVLSQHWSWATSHLSFVGELFKPEALEVRLDKLARARQTDGVGFHCFYTLLPPTSVATSRTFCVLPHSPATRACFTPNINSRASDEIQAHVEMFEDKSDGMYELARRTTAMLSEWVAEEKAGKLGAGAGTKEAPRMV